MMKVPIPQQFHGLAVVGEKGQTVIPVEARRALSLNKGDKLLVIGLGPEAIVLMRPDNLDQLTRQMTAHVAGLRRIADKVRSPQAKRMALRRSSARGKIR